MGEPAIINSLLRVDGFTGALPSGFDRPHPAMGFAVHELGSHQEFVGWWAAVETALQDHGEFLRQVQASAGMVTLFVETVAGVQMFRLEPPCLAALAKAGVAFEAFCAAR